MEANINFELPSITKPGDDWNYGIFRLLKRD